MKKVTGNSFKMPVLFIGHGSPMNAIEDNEFTQGFSNISSEIETPKAIVIISAHWETKGTLVTAMKAPRTIHDFGGFPKELYEIQYPAPGMPELAIEIQNIVKQTQISLDYSWGLDHGSWTVIKNIYPNADIPIIQLSLNLNKNAQEHYELSKELYNLRNKGILIIGSGNIVHNLSMIDWRNLHNKYAFDWAEEANNKIKELITLGDHQSLIKYSRLGKAFKLAIPTPEHYLPLLYILALQDKNDEIKIFNDKPIAGSLTMTSIKIF